MKLFVAKDSDGTVCLYTNKPLRKEYGTGNFAFDPDGGKYADVPTLIEGEVRELNFI